MRRFALQVLLCLALSGLVCEYSLAVGKITVDPNAGGSEVSKAPVSSDTRLAQKVTYEACYVSVRQILEDLTTITGIRLYVGYNKYDWQVRSRKMNIFVKDVKMADLMNSIAHSMKFKWSCNNDLNPPTYRLVVDSKATIAADAQKAQAEKQKEDLWYKRRKDWLDIIMRDGPMSSSQVDARSADPIFYRYARTGALRALCALFNEVPEAKNRFAAGQSFRISAQNLSENTRDLLFSAGDEFWKFLQHGRGPVVGFGESLLPDDEFDIAYVRLDVGSFTPNLRWSVFSQCSTGYFHIAKGERDCEIVDLKSRDAEWTRALCERENMIIDTDDRASADRILDARVPKLIADRDKEEESLYPSEPLNEHPDFAELENTIKLKIDIPKTEQNPEMVINSYIAAFQKALADATGLGVVSDSWVNISGDKLPDQEATLSKLLDKFSTQFNYNWDKPSTILEFRHRKWWKNRLNQISDDWVAAWSENTHKNGVLSLDDLAQISNLTYDQAEESLKADKVLGTAGIYKQILNILDTNGNLHWLHLYSTLKPDLRAPLMNRWISGAMLSSDQWNLAQAMFDRIGSLRSDALFSLRIVPNDSKLIYEFREFEVAAQRNDDTAKEDRKWVVTLPSYVPPPSKENEKH